MNARLAVVTVTYSPGEHLTDLIRSLPSATTRDTRLVMADNGSTDGAPEAAAQDFDFVELLRTGGNLGYGTAINRAVGEIVSRPDDFADDFVLVVNPDVEFGRGSVDALMDAAQRWPRAAVFGPQINDPDGTGYPSARALPNIRDGIGHALLGRLWPANPFSARYHADGDTSTERVAGWLSGACLLLRRDAFEAVGRFDENYFMYFEDVDLGDRLSRAGWQSVYVPGAVITHDRGHVATAVPEFTLRAHHRSAYRYLADRHTGLRWAPLRAVLRVGLAARCRLEIRAAERALAARDSRSSTP